MSTYFIDFVAYVDERKRPENFPHEVHVQYTYENIESTAHLQSVVNELFIKLVTSQGLVVIKDPDKILDQGVITFDRRRFVPWHLLTHMEVTVTMIPEQHPSLELVSGHSLPESKRPKEAVN